ncbi:MAG: hypothetical protein COA44_07425 [Arcobacter sp.]|nr:MAG: hypothetical protein COA44_07425 [Arcobacter sp.]
MIKINLLKETIPVNSKQLSQAFISQKAFGISINGSIKYPPFQSQDIFIYQSSAQNKQDFLGSNYALVEEKDHFLIKAEDAWPDILTYNLDHCDYNNTTSLKEVTEFRDEKMEDMAWMIIDFDVSYKEIFAFLEEHTKITLLCKQKNEPYEFSYMAFFDDILETQKIFYEFCQGIIKGKLSNDPDYTYDYLDEDQIEAVEYFKLVK